RAHASDAQAAEQTAAGLARKIREDEQQLEQLQKENEAAGQRRGEVSARLASLAAEQTRLAARIAAADSAAAAAAQQLETLAGQQQGGDDTVSALRQELEETNTYLKTLSADITR